MNVGDRLGRSGASVGDVDGDGVNDIAWGAFGDNDGISESLCGGRGSLEGFEGMAGAVYVGLRKSPDTAEFKSVTKLSNGARGLVKGGLAIILQ